ncbi:MAG: hypothetical protein GY847_29850, partial [Proteobacteria bacterium]|nr:hypothetical protein [Pseudomonadota bacterium]
MEKRRKTHRKTQIHLRSGDNAHRQLQVQELRDIINAFENVIEPVLHRKDIKFDKQIQG